MTTFTLISPEAALREANVSHVLNRLNKRQTEMVTWLANHMLNLPGPNGNSLLKDCILSAAALDGQCAPSEFANALTQPAAHLVSYAVIESRIWDPFAGNLCEWFDKGIRSVQLVNGAEIKGSSGALLGFVLLNRVLNFDEIAAGEHVQNCLDSSLLKIH